MVEQTLKDLITSNENNKPFVIDEGYDTGHYEGYHDALVDVMNKLNISHNEHYYND